jgi:hypothetical protein
MDFKFPSALRLRVRECYEPEHLDNRWDSLCVMPDCPRVEHLEDIEHSPRVDQLEDPEPARVDP